MLYGRTLLCFKCPYRVVNVRAFTNNRCADSAGGKHQEAHLSRLKAELGTLLRSTVLPQSLSRKFPTRLEDHQLLEGYKGERVGPQGSLSRKFPTRLELLEGYRGGATGVTV